MLIDLFWLLGCAFFLFGVGGLASFVAVGCLRFNSPTCSECGRIIEHDSVPLHPITKKPLTNGLLCRICQTVLSDHADDYKRRQEEQD
jgi:hypothetical protein